VFFWKKSRADTKEVRGPAALQDEGRELFYRNRDRNTANLRGQLHDGCWSV